MQVGDFGMEENSLLILFKLLSYYRGAATVQSEQLG
jgi:hypothetical protein